MNHNKRFLTFLSALLLAVVTAMAASISIKIVPLNGKIIHVNDKFQVIINLKGIAAEPDVEVPGAKIVGHNLGKKISIPSCGKYTTDTEVTLLCVAEEPGNYSFGPIKMAGVTSNNILYTIEDYSRDANIEEEDYTDIFLRAFVSNNTAYETEALVYTVKLYSTYARIDGIELPMKPKFDGFTVKDLSPSDAELAIECIGQTDYYTCIVSSYLLSPNITGRLSLKGKYYNIEVDKNEYYGDSDSESDYVVPLDHTPNDLTVNVLPLPEPMPDDFSGGVGQFTISSELDGQNFRTGEPYHITYTISGAGNLEYVVLPTPGFNLPKGIDIKSHVIDSNELVSGDEVTGTMRITYTFVPSEPGDFEISDFKLVYFNPATAQYETTVAKGCKIHVEKGNETDKAQRTVSAPVPQNPEHAASGNTIKATTV